ncbi:MAG: family 78 glycoside hydrolase catalytic domain [bacterium]
MKSESIILNASWIWLAGQSGSNKHQYVVFRKTFNLRHLHENQVLEISVDSDFVLFVNGREIGRGQFSDYPQEKTYTRFEVGGKLQEGRNCMAILAYHRGENFSEHRAGQPGLIVALNAGDKGILSDATWKCRQHPAFVSGDMPKVTGQQGFTTCFDARKDCSWTDMDFNDADWPDAAVQGEALSGYWREILPRPVPVLTQGKALDAKVLSQGNFTRKREFESFAETMANDALVSMWGNVVFTKEMAAKGYAWWANFGFHRDGGASSSLLVNIPDNGFEGAYFILDFGREETGLIHFDLDAPAGTVIDIGHGEHVVDGRIRIRMGSRNFADRYICREGINLYTLPFRRLGGRYLQVHVSNFHAPLKIRYFGLIPLALPEISTCEFRTSDTLAEKIYEISVRTLKCCMHEHYEDTPWREQSLYAFDGRNQALYGYYCFGNYDFAATSFDLLGRGIRADGLLELCAPAKIPCTIPMFSLVWISALAEHWMHAGSPVLFEKFSGQIKLMLEVVLARKDGGSGLYRTPVSPDLWHFYEWAPGLDNDRDPGERLDAPWNLFLHEALGAYAQMLRLSGNVAEAEEIEGKRAELGHAITQVFWDEQEHCLSTYIFDGKHAGFHQLIQALTLNEHILDGEREKVLLRKISSSDFPEMTLSSMLYLVRALMDQDEGSRKCVALIIHDHWGKMVLAGASTCWETIDGEAAFGGAGSLCHGWSALPVYYYHAYILGIRPLSPGFKTFSITPYCDRFFQAKGEVMTPYGKISAEWCRTGTGIEMSVNHPVECKPKVSPYPEYQSIRVSCNARSVT